MRIGGLGLFDRTNSRRSFIIASYHSPHSLTWSWSLLVSFDATWRKPNGWLRLSLSRYRTNGGPQYVVALPFVVFQRSQQEPMWFRDMFRRASDREEALERKVSQLRRELTLARVTALADEGRPQ